MFAGAYFVIRSVSLRALSTASFVSQPISSAFTAGEIAAELATRDCLNQRGNPFTATAIASMPLLEVWRVGQGFLLFLAQRRIQHPAYL